jgi:hypothetical protein
VFKILLFLSQQQVKGVFEFHIRNDFNNKEIEIITIDLKNNGSVTYGKGHYEPDTIILMADNDFINVARGRICSMLSL